MGPWKILMISIIFLGRTSESESNQGDGPNHFSVTWAPPDANNPFAFNEMPRTESDAIQAGWTQTPGNGCNSGSHVQYKGKRYIKDEDYSVLIIYDKNGYVAGMESGIPEDLAKKNGVVNYTINSAAYTDTIAGQKVILFLVYFVDPKIVCKGRNSTEFQRQGTIDRLFVRNGSHSFTELPKRENEQALLDQGWTKGKCVDTMGHHYYKGLECCDNFYPIFLMYDHLKNCLMTGFGFVTYGHYQRDRYEYPPQEALINFVEPVPDCVNSSYTKANGITSMHVFNVDALNVICPKTTVQCQHM